MMLLHGIVEKPEKLDHPQRPAPEPTNPKRFD
jgi:hypothetical protein